MQADDDTCGQNPHNDAVRDPRRWKQDTFFVSNDKDDVCARSGVDLFGGKAMLDHEITIALDEVSDFSGAQFSLGYHLELALIHSGAPGKKCCNRQ